MATTAEDPGPSPAGDERRRWPRLSIHMPIRQLWRDELTFQRSRDLSAGGVQLDWSLSMPLGASVELRFSLPDQPRLLRLQAEVAANQWEGRPCTSLRFVDTPYEIRALIARFVATRLHGRPGRGRD